MNLPVIDAVLVLALLGGLIWAGYWGRRLVRSVSQFTIAGREMGMWLGLSTAIAEGIGLISIANACQQGFRNGFSFIWLSLASLLLINIPLFGIIGFGIKRYRATNVQTLPQYYEQRYDRGVRIFAGFVLALGGVLNMAIFPIVESQFLIEFLEIPNRELFRINFFGLFSYPIGAFHVVLLILLALATFFTFLGGMVTVIITDYIQSVLIYVSVLVVSLLVLKFTDLASMREAVETHIGPAAFSPLKTHGGRGIGLVFTLVFLLNAITHRLAFPPALQKMSAAKSPEVVRKMFLLSTIFGQGRGILFVAWGIAALALFGPATPPGFASAELYHRVVGARFLRTIMEGIPLMKGIALAGFIFASISTNDSYLLSWASVIANDCICAVRRRPLPKERHIGVLRLSAVGIAAFIFLFGCWYDPKQTILQYFYLTGLLFTVVGLITWFGLYWSRITSAGAWACLLSGLALVTGWFIFDKYFMVATMKAHPNLERFINVDNLMLFGTLFPAILMIVVSMLTRKPQRFVDYGKKLRELEEAEREKRNGGQEG